MLQIQAWNQDPKQKLKIILPNNDTIDMQIEYKPLQYGWFINSLSYNDFTLTGLRITTNLNILYQYKNKLPFGILIQTVGNREPYLVSDFQTGACKMFILTAEELDQLENIYSGQV